MPKVTVSGGPSHAGAEDTAPEPQPTPAAARKAHKAAATKQGKQGKQD